MRIRANFVREGDWWVAWTEDVPGTITEGATLTEARGRLVEAIYAKSSVSLQADLRQLAQAPRISAAAAAVAAAETLTSYSGAIAGPVIVVDNIGDPVDADAYKRAYERTIARAGRGELLRTTWVRSARHANQSALEKLAGFVKLVERLDTGSWTATTPQAIRAPELPAGSVTSSSGPA